MRRTATLIVILGVCSAVIMGLLIGSLAGGATGTVAPWTPPPPTVNATTTTVAPVAGTPAATGSPSANLTAYG